MPTMNVALLDAAESVRSAYVESNVEAARRVERKLVRVAGRVAAGQTQLADYQASLARQLRVLTGGERRKAEGFVPVAQAIFHDAAGALEAAA